LGGEIESHSIDIIPDDERGGKVSGQFTLWFATNANVFNYVLGGFAILFGLNVFWALIAMFLGSFLGLAFTSLHAVAGPAARGTADDPVPGPVRVLRRGLRIPGVDRAGRRLPGGPAGRAGPVAE